MFPAMRRKKQLLSQEETAAVLSRGSSGVLALAGEDGYPYAVPLSYVYDGGRLYFHCARSGHKLDAIRQNEKASFCVIGQDVIVPEEYTTYYTSAIVFGQIHILEDEAEKRRAIEKLAVKYAPKDSEAGRQAAINKDFAPLCMLKLSIGHMSGKQSIELTRRKESRQA